MSFDTAKPYAASFMIFRKGNKVAFVLRANTGWGDGRYGLPAGKVEKGETFAEAAIREAKEEVGATVKPADIRYLLTVHRHGEDMDWIDVVFEAQKWTGELQNLEPKVHSELKWLDLDNLPENMVLPVRFYLEQIKAGNTYAEYGWNN